MYLKSSPPVLLKKASPTSNRTDHEEWLRPRYDRLREWGVRWVMSQVPLARKEPQERPALLGDVVADRAAQHGITRLERVQHRVPGDPAGQAGRTPPFPFARVRRGGGRTTRDKRAAWPPPEAPAGGRRPGGAN